MTLSTVRLGDADGDLAEALASVRDELNLTAQFPKAVLAEATEAVKAARLPERSMLDVPFFTIDPPESMDLDQAMHLARNRETYTVRYAIADVPAFVVPGGAVDTEARKRGQTYYPPDGRIPLHPVAISEGAASLLPGTVCGAFVWTFELDADGRVTATQLERAKVRSVARYDYAQIQSLSDVGEAPEGVTLLREVGEKRIALERERGGASLGRPDQEVRERNGHYELFRRQPVQAESWNAQISLMTGMEAAKIMLQGKLGILRTMPPPSEESVTVFRRRAAALGTPWPRDIRYGEYLRSLDPANPRELAIMHAAATLFRGAGYSAFDGELPELVIQSAVAAPYAHATAPLRRLVDRFVLVVCEALAHGRQVPDWARIALPELPGIMNASDSLAGRLSGETVNRVEAAVLRSRVGEAFEATVLTADDDGGDIQLDDPAVTAHCEGSLTPGERVRAHLEQADIASGTVRFRALPDAARDGVPAESE